MKHYVQWFYLLVLSGLMISTTATAQQQSAENQFTPQQRVEMLKHWLQESQVLLRSYEWIETTTIAIDGEVKASNRNQVYFAVDGNLQKVPIADPEEESGGPPGVLPPGRLAKRRIEKKREQIKEYMQEAKALMQSYVPPDPNLLQQGYGSGNFGVNMIRPGQLVRLEFNDYLKPGDQLSFDIEVASNRLIGIQVSSYMDSPDDPVSAVINMGLLPDGIIHTAKTTLNAPSEDAVVTIENSGYRQSGG